MGRYEQWDGGNEGLGARARDKSAMVRGAERTGCIELDA